MESAVLVPVLCISVLNWGSCLEAPRPRGGTLETAFNLGAFGMTGTLKGGGILQGYPTVCSALLRVRERSTSAPPVWPVYLKE